MGVVTGLKKVEEPTSVWTRLTGGFMAAALSRSQSLPITPDKAPVYAAALAGGTVTGDARNRMACALLHCDLEARQYTPARLDWYTQAFTHFPEDERCAFFMAALAQNNVLSDTELVAHVYTSLLESPHWKASRYWSGLGLSRSAVERDLIRHLSARPASAAAGITPSQVALIERVYERSKEDPTERGVLGSLLARVYRAQGRNDEHARQLFASVLSEGDEDTDAAAYMANKLLEKGEYDTTACAAFARMVAHAEKRGDVDGERAWLGHLARAFVEIGRVDEGSVEVLRRAAAIDPEDLLIGVALLYAVAKTRTGILEEASSFVSRLEKAVLEREEELAPLFVARRWEWGCMVRALALSWGHAGRVDPQALDLYERATRACPNDRTLWALRARALAQANIQDEAALEVYERVRAAGQANDAVHKALARTYVALGAAHREERRREAIALWEDLYRQGAADSGMIAELVQAYTGDDRVNDVALSLWAKAVEEDKENGLLRLRLGREWRLRGETEVAARWLNEAARLLPKHFEAQYEAGLILKEHYSDHAGAVKHLQKAVKLPGAAKHTGVHFALGESLLLTEKRDEALAVFQKIVEEIDPEHTPTLLHLAKLNLRYEEQGVKREKDV